MSFCGSSHRVHRSAGEAAPHAASAPSEAGRSVMMQLHPGTVFV